MSTKEGQKDRLQYIAWLQILGPLFVILGHSLNGIQASGLWYDFSKTWIYIFHMPLFFFISGYLFSYKYKAADIQYGKFIKGKVVRLLIPYIAWNLIFLLPKFVLQGFVGEKVELDIVYLITIFLHPRNNVCGHSWFLAALFLTYCFTPVWFRLVRYKKAWLWILVTIGFLVLYFIPMSTRFMCINDLHKDLLYFWIGIMLGSVDKENLFKILENKRLGFLITILMAVSSFVTMYIIASSATRMIACVAILMFLLCVSYWLSKKDVACTDAIARDSFGIYILHWPFMLVTRVLMYQILHLNTILTVIAVIIIGYAAPLLVLYVARKIKIKAVNKIFKYTLGI